MIKKIGVTDDPKEFCRPEIFFPRRFRRHVYLRDQSIEVMRDILQSRYLRSNVAHKQLARTSSKEITDKRETSYTKEETVSTWRMFMGRIFEVITRDTACALGSEKYFKRSARFCRTRSFCRWVLAA